MSDIKDEHWTTDILAMLAYISFSLIPPNDKKEYKKWRNKRGVAFGLGWGILCIFVFSRLGLPEENIIIAIIYVIGIFGGIFLVCLLSNPLDDSHKTILAGVYKLSEHLRQKPYKSAI